MNIEVTKRYDRQFRIGLVIDGKPQKFTLKAAKQLRTELEGAIEWAVNMDDMLRESEDARASEEARVAADAAIARAK